MKKTFLLTLIYIICDWDLNLDYLITSGKIIFWIPNLLNNILTVLFKVLISPFIFLSFGLFEKYKRLILRFYVYWKESIEFIWI